ncbi:MAG: M23 family metallopeptidase [Myxococcaceae bacterium]
MPLLPSLGPEEKKSPLVPIIAATVAIAALAGGVLLYRRSNAPPPPPPLALAIDAGAPVPAAPPTPAAQLAQAGLKQLSIKVDGPLETGVIGAVGKQVGAPLTQVLTRTLVWWVRVPQDLVKGDGLEAIYEERGGDEPLVHAVRFTSGKHGKTFAAYRFQAQGDSFARFYLPSGEELELRLEDAPIDTYEQITSLLKDGRRHKGVDFKTAVGTPVKATFDGTITRRTWSFRGNGNCFELAESGGARRSALYLHLSELPKDLQAGRRVKKGEVLASSGNTGHSYAPHLHYQLMSPGGEVLDPFESHRTYHKKIAPGAQAGLGEAVRRFDTLMSGVVATPFP